MKVDKPPLLRYYAALGKNHEAFDSTGATVRPARRENLPLDSLGILDDLLEVGGEL